MQSLSYYLTIFIVKLKGIKKEFTRDPIDYIKLRREDVHLSKIPGASRFSISNTFVTEITNASASKDLIIYIHGGAFVYGPAKHHWDTVKKIAEATATRVWMIDYPKAPENNICQISANIDHVYENALNKAGSGKIILIGDSVGGTLIAALTQRLVSNGTPLPSLIILISPVMDASFKNDMILNLEDVDPILSRKGALSAKKMCAVNGDLDDPSISPLNGSFKGFPNSLIYIAENDITSPDQELLARKLKNSGITHKIVRGKGMPHIWPLLPVMKESKQALNEIITEIKKEL